MIASWGMAPMHSPDNQPAFDAGERSILLELARGSILHGLENAVPLSVDPARYPQPLQRQRASFVTLNRFGELRGCIGHLKAVQPLVADVSENAYSAAFRDPRFPRLENSELVGLELHISVLTPAKLMHFSSQRDLLEKLRPGIDGLILKTERQQGTFLPSVWESLPDSRTFLEHLKLKAGLSRDYWSDEIKVYRYGTESFAAPFHTAASADQG